MTDTTARHPRKYLRTAALVVVASLVATACQSTNPTTSAAGPSSSNAPSAAAPSPASPGPTSPGPASPSPATSSPSASPSSGLVPVVPVVAYRSGLERVGHRDVAAALGGGGTWSALELVASDADAVLAALAVGRPADSTRLVLAADAPTLATDLRAHPDRLAFLRASAVGPSVRALAWGKSELFGVDRVRSVADWTLEAALAPDPAPFDPAAVWTLWAGGDLGLDRTVAHVVLDLGKGVDYPYDGGTARIAGTTCCSSFGWVIPRIVRTGNAGAVRHLISAADLALANMEESAPDHWAYHPHGTVFTGDPALIAGIAGAGVDVVSCASTHIGDGGRPGILETLRNLDRYGVRHFGAGKDLAAAREPAWFTIGGVRVAILGYDAVAARWYAAGPTTIGSSPLVAANVRTDVAAARNAGAQVVIVYPHWGTEYTRGPNDFQRSMAHLMIDAGADIVIGNHPHWVQSVEIYKGRPIWYALGNFTFDQTWSEPTLEGISLELTFDGATLVQARMLPHVLIGGVQPNLLDPAGDGRRVLDPVFAASAKLLSW